MSAKDSKGETTHMAAMISECKPLVPHGFRVRAHNALGWSDWRSGGGHHDPAAAVMGKCVCCRERERKREREFFFCVCGYIYARCANLITSSASPWTSLLVESKALSITLNPSGTPPGL